MIARRQADQALVASDGAQEVSTLTGFDPSRGSLDYRVSWPRPATPCDLVPLWKGEFNSFGDWVSFATTRLTGTTDDDGRDVSAICVDALGRRCSVGRHFARARDEGAFPVRYFWECVPAIAIEAQRAVTTQIGTVRSTKARAAGIAQTTPPSQPRERK